MWAAPHAQHHHQPHMETHHSHGRIAQAFVQGLQGIV
jgi:hypothetical protein